MSKRKKARAKKGDVSIGDRNGMLRLRWRYQGKEYQLSLGMPDTPLNRHLAQGKAATIQADLVYGRFDPTLDRYRDQPVLVDATPTASTPALFLQFIEFKRKKGVSGQSLSTKYQALLANLKRLELDIKTEDDARAMVDLLRARQCPRVANQNLSLLKEFGSWLVAQSHAETNVFAGISPLKGANSVKVQNRKPFNREEVKALLEAVRVDPIYYRYHDFCLVMLQLGIRPSEAIGLRWKHIDLARQEVTISESLSRGPDGRSAGSARQRKATKTENIRVLPLNERLVVLFSGRKLPSHQPEDLVFTTARGKAIDDRMFRERVWKRICERAGVEYRPPYTSRHTLLSHGIEYEGWSLVQAARVAGHSSTRMVAETYGHMIDQPRLPDY